MTDVIWQLLLVTLCQCRSQRPRGLRRRSTAARLLRLWVRIPPGAWMSVYCECRVLLGRVLCDELITRPEESYRLWCFVVCDQETSWMRRPWPIGVGWGGDVALKANKANKHSVSKYTNNLPIRYRITSYPLFLGLYVNRFSLSVKPQYSSWRTDCDHWGVTATFVIIDIRHCTNALCGTRPPFFHSSSCRLPTSCGFVSHWQVEISLLFLPDVILRPSSYY